jgi:benzoyl-CoA reductase/2-hydroxyglutaryl-CoA dehydratase subunit BcrC/BadD/HgdB
MCKHDYIKNAKEKSKIDKEITENLKAIDDELKKTHRSGHGEAIIGLPLMFSIPNMPNITAQTKIYAAILMSLKSRGFNPKFEIGEKMCALHVSWVSETEKQENDEMMRMIAEHTVTEQPSTKP